MTIRDPADRPLTKLVTVGWLALGIGSIALALIGAMVLRAERESNAIIFHLNAIALNLQDVLSDIADAQLAEREFVLTAKPEGAEAFEVSRRALEKEFDRLTELVKSNAAELTEVNRVRALVGQDLDELQQVIVTRRSSHASVPISATLTERARKLTQTLRDTINGIDDDESNTVTRLARERHIRLSRSLAALSAALFLAGCYLLLSQGIFARTLSRHQRAEEALEASEGRFRALCEQAPSGLYATDAEGQCIYTNRKWTEISGLSFTESLGHGWARALHPEDRETVFNGWKTAAMHEASWEYRLLTPHGEIRWVRALGGPIFSMQGQITGYVGTAEDITERKIAHQALQDREILNRAILNSLPAGIAVLDVDGRIQAINQEWQHFAEAQCDSPACAVGIGANYLETWERAAQGGSVDAEKATAGIQAVLTGEVRFFLMEYPWGAGSGKRWFRLSVTPLSGIATGGVVIAQLDITERKQAKDAVREALLQLQLITENMPVGVTRCSRDLRYLWVSNSYASWLQRSVEGIAGHKIPDVLGQDGYETLRPYIERVLSGERVEYETQVEYPGRGKRWIHGVYVPTKDQGGDVDGWIAVAADVTERHEAEERLRESEELFRATFFQAAVGIAQTGMDGHWLLLNDRFCEILGYSREELRGKTFIDITHPDDREKSLAGVRELVFGNASSWSMQKRYICKDGATVWGRTSVSLVRDRHHKPLYFVAAVEDITQTVEAEERIRESEERFRNMADTAPVMIWVSGTDKGCTFFNKTWLDFTGRTMEQEMGSGWAAGVHPDDLDRCVAVYSSSFDARKSFQMEYRLRRADGEYRWLLDTGIPRFTSGNVFQGYIGSCIDITERIRAEEERQKFVSLADRSMEFIGMYDGDLRPLYVNPAGRRLVGLDDLDAACRVKIADYFFPEDQHFITDEFLPRVLRNGHGTIEIRFRNFKTGEAIWMIYNVMSIFDAHGAIVGWATVSIDVTERKRAERALQESQRELRALAGRLIHAEEAERKRISRELHDDLSQKLAMIAFDTGSLILTPPASVKEIKEPLHNLQTRVVQLSQDVRRISHGLHPSILEDLGLEAALSELCEEFSARNGIEALFEQEGLPKSLPVEIASCLYRVAQEALYNVLKHAQASQVRVRVSRSLKGIHLHIDDTGIGFDAEAAHSRPGLGIVSMQERVRLVQGEFFIHSQPGKGTEVRVFVPLSGEIA
jgi:PAS domain S-box-containing protein